MADVQNQFIAFHKTIRVDYDMAADLREKRDIVVARIKKYLAGQDLPGCRILLQGSYKLRTGVRPIGDLEYDIDIGLLFDISTSDYEASTVRKWIVEAVSGHTNKVVEKGPCIRVFYAKGFHLDLVTYSDHAGHFHLAHKSDGWRPADPPGLVDYITRYRVPLFDGTNDSATDTDQFRRCIRYLRRWDDVRITRESDAKPSGLGWVLLGIQRGLTPATSLDERADDRRALEGFVRTLAETSGCLQADKPTPEYEDVLSKIGDSDMETLKAKLSELAEDLRYAGTVADPTAACKRLRSQFGEDFPVPDPKDTARRTSAPAVVPSSHSG